MDSVDELREIFNECFKFFLDDDMSCSNTFIIIHKLHFCSPLQPSLSPSPHLSCYQKRGRQVFLFLSIIEEPCKKIDMSLSWASNWNHLHISSSLCSIIVKWTFSEDEKFSLISEAEDNSGTVCEFCITHVALNLCASVEGKVLCFPGIFHQMNWI